MIVSSGYNCSSLLSSLRLADKFSDPRGFKSTSSDLACGVTTSFNAGDTSFEGAVETSVSPLSFCFRIVILGLAVVLYCQRPGVRFSLNLYKLLLDADAGSTVLLWMRVLYPLREYDDVELSTGLVLMLFRFL